MKVVVEIPYEIYDAVINNKPVPVIPAIKRAIKNGKIKMEDEVIEETKKVYETVYGVRKNSGRYPIGKEPIKEETK